MVGSARSRDLVSAATLDTIQIVRSKSKIMWSQSVVAAPEALRKHQNSVHEAASESPGSGEGCVSECPHDGRLNMAPRRLEAFSDLVTSPVGTPINVLTMRIDQSRGSRVVCGQRLS